MKSNFLEIKELNKKGHGLILIVDEMGKFLDYASSVGSDLNLFQEIAENFSNARLNKEGEPIFIGILHQPFEEYASSLGRSVQEDWQKIQGRFEDIPFSINLFLLQFCNFSLTFCISSSSSHLMRFKYNS